MVSQLQINSLAFLDTQKNPENKFPCVPATTHGICNEENAAPLASQKHPATSFDKMVFKSYIPTEIMMDKISQLCPYDDADKLVI